MRCFRRYYLPGEGKIVNYSPFPLRLRKIENVPMNTRSILKLIEYTTQLVTQPGCAHVVHNDSIPTVDLVSVQFSSPSQRIDRRWTLCDNYLLIANSDDSKAQNEFYLSNNSTVRYRVSAGCFNSLHILNINSTMQVCVTTYGVVIFNAFARPLHNDLFLFISFNQSGNNFSGNDKVKRSYDFTRRSHNSSALRYRLKSTSTVPSSSRCQISYIFPLYPSW